MSATRTRFGPGERVVVTSAARGRVGLVVGVIRAQRRESSGKSAEITSRYLVRWPTRAGRHVTNQVAATALRAATDEEVRADAAPVERDDHRGEPGGR
jgi:hypothetical protein